ncbi:PIN-like domain-containing protein [Clostridium botulinum]|uniref:PIN like domain-containing protein n=1 Tax=Clostridium botulinum (strain Langeland / NCTC 10281 / Type F) TaxID=441772 RepID=A7GF30_CLOBL|nr:PIN-like domain-containing protein [Clostridium botulinum]ABS39914.1 hypothetical protein CLI_2135 [Clostridium botulinum F str. Langeland]ADF99795.1 hypothetical protein CBF_2120 [Clostridium botulinum F str. 230613]KKM42629.1 hypothetical protein VT72_03040 [Clostridium botulinum]MBY6794093.1 hypothetical protein [Clostridium botulinum]MBY6937092.1 hypothetical protein [Clostridium botulinum]
MAYIYPKSEITNILTKEPIIIMDTNVWLDLYSLSPDTIRSIIESLSETEFVWLPNEVYIEFKRHVKEKRDENINRYQKLKEEICRLLSDNQNKANSVFNTYNRFKLPDVLEQNEFLKAEISKIQSEVSKKLEKIQANHSDNMALNGIDKNSDCIEEYINELYLKCNAKRYSTMELLKIYEEGEKRYKYKIAPGFTDAKKKDNVSSEIPERKYGDLIIWKEILNLISSKDKDIIFINNEKKSDWWVPEIVNKNRIPTVLKEEFQQNSANNNRFVMLTFDEFISHCGEELNIHPQSILEVTERISFIGDINKYFNDNLLKIIEDFIYQNSIEEVVIKKISEDTLGESIAGGNIDEIDDIEISDIKIIKEGFDFDGEEFQVYIRFDAEILVDAYISVYWNKESGTNGKVEIKSSSSFEVIYTIDYTQSPLESYSIYDYDIEQFNITKINFDQYDFDEDLTESGEYTCPDCGRKYDIEEDGGNGFCIDCAGDH